MFQVGHISPFNAQWLLYVPSGLTLKILRSTHTVNLRVAYGSQNKGQLVPRTLTDWFLKGGGVFTARYELNLPTECR